MNKVFHQTAPLIALKFMPEKFRAFLICDSFSEEALEKYSDIPDMVDKDNMTQDAEIHHAHSYKLELKDGNLHWLDGDALERLKGLCADAHDFNKEGNLDMVRYCLSKMTHYRVDSLTYPHLHRGKPWSLHHESFETEMGKFMAAHKEEITEMSFTAYHDVYKDCRATSCDMWYLGKDVVERLERGEKLTDTEKLEICKACVKGIGDLWTTLAQEMKLL